MNRTTYLSIVLGAALLYGLPALAVAQTTTQKQQPAQQQKPVQQQTYVPARPSALDQAKTAAQGPGPAARVFNGQKVNTSTPVQVQTSTATPNAAAIAAQQNAAEQARQKAVSQKYGIDKVRVP
jgi:hypothetical protein